MRSPDIPVRFYRQTVGADELSRSSGPGGRVGHCELLVAGGCLLLVEEFPDTGTVSPETLGGTPVTLHLFVADTDPTYRRALDAGGFALMPACRSRRGRQVRPGHRPLKPQMVDVNQTRRPQLHDMAERGERWRHDCGNPTSPGEVPGIMAEGKQ